MTRVDVVGLAEPTARRLRAAARVTEVLAVMSRRAVSARLTFTDQNGPTGGPAVRCAATVTVAGWGPLHVEDLATTPALALTGTLARLERRLARRRELDREGRRRPKKYYAAARARAGASAAGVRPRRRRRGAVS